MDAKTIKAMFDACYQAKRIREMLPPLPKGVTPAYIIYLDVIETLGRDGAWVKVSDISDALNLPRPGVTRTIQAMTVKGYLCKNTSPNDGRITYVSVTEAGKLLSKKYNEEYFNQLLPFVQDLSQEDVNCTIRTIRTLYTVMSERRISVE